MKKIQTDRIEWSENFDFFDKKDLTKFRKISLKHDDIVYAENIKFMIFLKGSASLVYYDKTKEFILNYIKAGNYVVLDSETILKITDNSEILELNIKDIEQFLGNKDFSMSLVNALIRAILAQRRFIKILVLRDVKQKIRTYFENLARIDGDKIIASVPGSVTEFAEFIAASRQHVSSAINQLKKDGEIVKISKDTYELKFCNLKKKENHA